MRQCRALVVAELAVDVVRIIELDVEIVDVGQQSGVIDLASRHFCFCFSFVLRVDWGERKKERR